MAENRLSSPRPGARASEYPGVPKPADSDSASTSNAETAPIAKPSGLGFAALGVPETLVRLLDRAGITEPFPIQSATLPDSLAGRDVLGRGRTGSGKTLAFGLPVLTRLANARRDRKPGRPRALILAPTRELAIQIDATIAPLAKSLGLRTTTIFGGVGQNPQIDALRNGVDVVVACPGRLEDLITQGHCKLDRIEIAVLDEADHMADLGFLPGVKRLLDRAPDDCQHMLFSATLDNGIDVIVKRYLHNPVTHSVDSEQSPVNTMTHHVLHVATADRLPVLVDLTSAPGRSIVFTRTKYRAKTLTKQLNASGVPAVEMHGNLTQNVRVRNLAAFSEGRAVVLVATDIAARGIHVDDVTLVIHADPPIEHKAYLHRSGRTARAGNDGTVVTIVQESERREVSQLMKKAGIDPIVTAVTPGNPLLQELAPGVRHRRSPTEIAAAFAVEEPRGARPNSRSSGRPKAAAGAPGARHGRTGQGGRRGSGGSAAGGSGSGSGSGTGGGPRTGSKPGGSRSGSAPAGRSSRGGSTQSTRGGGAPTGRGRSGGSGGPSSGSGAGGGGQRSGGGGRRGTGSRTTR
jgi:superfamily II DNA/RNA helicase